MKLCLCIYTDDTVLIRPEAAWKFKEGTSYLKTCFLIEILEGSLHTLSMYRVPTKKKVVLNAKHKDTIETPTEPECAGFFW